MQSDPHWSGRTQESIPLFVGRLSRADFPCSLAGLVVRFPFFLFLSLDLYHNDIVHNDIILSVCQPDHSGLPSRFKFRNLSQVKL